jgi:hypothetical protein
MFQMFVRTTWQVPYFESFVFRKPYKSRMLLNGCYLATPVLLVNVGYRQNVYP